MQPFLLKTLHVLPNIGIDRTDALQHQFPQYIFPDIVGRTGASTAFVAGAYIVVLLTVKAFAGSKVQLIPTIGTEQKPGEQSLPFRFCGTAFVFSQLLHPVPLSLRNDCFLRIREDTHIFDGIGNPLLQLIGLGIGLEIAGTAGVLHPFQNTHNRLTNPMVRALRHFLTLFRVRMIFRLFGIQRLGSQHLILLQYTGNLFRPLAVNSQVKDALDYWGGILVNDPMVFIGRVSAITIGRFSQMLSAGAFLPEYDSDFFAGVPWIPLVEQITDSGKTIAVAPFTVHTIIDGDKAHIVAGENDVRVLPNGQVISAKSTKILDQPATDKPLLNQCKAFLHAGAVKIGSRISVIHQNFQVGVAMLGCVPG